MATQITINPSALRSMLADLKLTAGDDDTLPMLNGINLHIDDRNGSTILVGTSTNRFIFGQDHIAVTGNGDPVFLPMDFVNRILSALEPHGPYGLHHMTGTLTADDNTITFTATGLKEFTTLTAERPKYGFVETFKFIKDPTPLDGPIAIAPRWMKLLAKIAERHEARIVFQPGGQNDIQHAQIGGTFRALVMPVKEPDMALLPIYVPTKSAPVTPSTEAGAA